LEKKEVVGWAMAAEELEAKGRVRGALAGVGMVWAKAKVVEAPEGEVDWVAGAAAASFSL
jgi:hypothetical protein